MRQTLEQFLAQTKPMLKKPFSVSSDCWITAIQQWAGLWKGVDE
ncbi:MAG TPA: hypothetical protein VFF80_02250 [Bacillota bacterium]|nr:hypothetical protein [Bacillota bacterium]